MKDTAKRILVALLAGVMCIGFAGCNSNTNDKNDETTAEAEYTMDKTTVEETTVEETTEEITEEGSTEAAETEPEAVEVNTKNGMDGFDITYYWGPHGEQMIDESFFEKIAEAGFTSIPLEHGSVEYNKIALGYIRKYGMTCSSLMDTRIDNLAGHDRSVSPDTPQEEVDRVVSEVVAEYADYMDVIKGWWIQDEPVEARFEILSKIVKAFRKYSPDKTTMINLFPVYADSSVFGPGGYQGYLDAFIDQVDPHYISYDHYHFFANGSARNDFFMNLEMVRDKAIESNRAPMIIILITRHFDYADVTPAQIAWEVNTSLTYGMKRISYFTFILDQDLLNEGWTNAFMSYTGEIWPHYYDVQKVNEWLLPLGTELFEKESTAVFHTKDRKNTSLEVGCEEYISYGDLGHVAGQNFVIGFFDDGSFMITNKTYKESDGKYNTLTFSDIESGLEYFDTESASWRNAEEDGIVTRNYYGKLCRKFDLGEGILFRVNKG